ncbi:phage holin [Viridibacillus arvi]
MDAFINALFAAVPFILIVYGVYKNSYIMTKQAKEQEQLLKEKGLK